MSIDRMFLSHNSLRNCLVPAIMLCLCSCGPAPREPSDAKETTPVTGVVTLDGEPAWGVRVYLNPKAGMDAANPTVSQGETDKDGKLKVGTYGTDDGAPAGDYVLTFEHYDRSKVILGGGGAPDLFQGLYSDPSTSTHTVSIPAGPESHDLGTIELTSP